MCFLEFRLNISKSVVVIHVTLTVTNKLNSEPVILCQLQSKPERYYTIQKQKC